MNDLEVKTYDIQNAYLNAPFLEKIWTTLGSEFGPNLAGKKALVVRALYGLKYACALFRNNLEECMRNLGYSLCLEDPDLWFKEEKRKSEGTKYYAYLLLYVDDYLLIHHSVDKSLYELDHLFKMQPGSIGYPNMYLVAKLRKLVSENGVEEWITGASKYVQEAVSNS